jgi:hypothetical protein
MYRGSWLRTLGGSASWGVRVVGRVMATPDPEVGVDLRLCGRTEDCCDPVRRTAYMYIVAGCCCVGHHSPGRRYDTLGTCTRVQVGATEAEHLLNVWPGSSS